MPPPLVPALALPGDAVADAVAQLDRIGDELMKDAGIPGMAVAVVHGGKAVYTKGFGVKDVRDGDDPKNRVDADTVFQLASLSKPLAATVVAHQVRENAISWDTPVVSKLPWFALSDPVVEPDGHRRGSVLAPLRSAGPRRRPAGGPGLRPALHSGPPAPVAVGSVPNLVRLQQFRTHCRRRCGSRRRRPILGGPQRSGAVPAAGHVLDELAVRGLSGADRPRRRAHQNRQPLRAAVPAQRETRRRPRAG